jgi:phospholipase C
MLENILDNLKANPELFEETAFIVTFDEGGGALVEACSRGCP